MSWQEDERKKLGRPIEGEQRKVPVNITLDKEVVDRLQKIPNRSKLINQLLKDYLQ
jgi:uncharacterized protein (DUF4415 family)